MQRGDIFLCSDAKGDFTNKPRPVLIVQATDYLGVVESVTICPITSVLSKASLRITVKALSETGLNVDSSVEVDKISTVKLSRLGNKIGVMPAQQRFQLDNALRDWLDL